ncbi:sigma-70 family RNA polymerase sigma factor [Streptomyces palmae]|uniref:Sigma-70 family RNA polymerase sigma factor n=2 Tax=Streptomyces palmae TaxID=1701085 RepID=A0A4Z0FU30_9ACTN|nr:sigma-70 family RNA polymerase sigma factor [Streptomyces palmae]TGA84899.1 sigma-70 family RNA polymerase sigma factor [Streptomyces palmae]
MTGLPDQLPVDFRAFHQLHRPAYVHRAASLLNNHSDAEEAVDTAFEQLARDWDKVLAMENPAAYAWTVMKNRAIDLARARGRRPYLLQSAAFETLALRTAVDPIGQLEESMSLCQAVRDLPERQQDVIILWYFHGYTSAQIATHLGITAAGVRSTARSARRALHEALVCKGSADDLAH